MGQPRRTSINRIADPQKRRVAFSKRRPTLFTKARELSTVADSDVSVRVRSSTGITYCESYQRGKLICSNKVNSSTVSREWEEALVKQECDACTTKEDLQSVVAKYEAHLAYARERLGNWENNPSVKVDCDTEIFPDEEIDSLLEGFKASHPSLWALCKDSVGHGDCEGFWTSLVNSAARGASDPTSSALDDCEFNVNDLPRSENSAIGGPSNPTCSDLDGSEFNPDAFLNLSEDCIGDGDRPESSIVGRVFNPNDFARLEDLDISLDIGDF